MVQVRDFPAVSVWFSVKEEAKSFVACKGNCFLAVMLRRVEKVWKSPCEELKSNPAGEMWKGVAQLSMETILGHIVSPTKHVVS